MADKRVVYMSTSTLENAVEIILNANAFEHVEDARETAERHFEQVFRVTIEPL